MGLRYGLALLAVLALIGGAAWWWSDSSRDRASRAPAPQAEPVAPVPEEDEPDDDPSDAFDSFEPLRVSVVTVVDQEGRPVRDALVVLFEYDELFDDRSLVAGSTDADGIARFDGVEADRIKVRMPGFAVASADADAESSITLAPALAVRGRAVVLGGGPAAGATIRVWDKDEDEEIDLERTTGEDGTFDLTGIRAHHPFVVVATYPDHAPVVTTRSGTDDVLLTFGDGLTLTGAVEDASGNPVAATMVVAPEGADSPFERQPVQLGYEQRELLAMARPACTEGRFSVRGMQPGDYVVYAGGEAGRGRARLDLDDDRHVVVRVVQAAVLIVHVVGPAGGEMTRGSVAVARGEDWDAFDSGEEIALAPGRHVVAANADDYVGTRREVELKAGEERTIEMRLREGLSVAGRVVDERGAPVVDQEVGIEQQIGTWFYWRQGARTDEAGAWRARGLAPGKGTLTVSARGYYAHRQEIDVAADARFDVRLERRGRIVGRFVPPPEGKRLGASFDSSNSSMSTSTVTREDGSFEFRDPDMQSPVTLTLEPEGGTPVVFRDLEIVRGQVRDLGDLAYVKGVALRLTVLDRGGGPIEGALVEIRDPGYVPGLRTDANGYVEVANQPRKLALRIVATDHAAAYRRVDASEPVTIRLAPGVAVTGRVVRPDGAAGAHAYIVFWSRRSDGSPDDTEAWKPEVDPAGRFACLLPPGKYRVRVYGEHRQLLPETFEAAEGAEFELKLR